LIPTTLIAGLSQLAQGHARRITRGGNAQAYIYRWRGNGPWQALNGGLPQPLKNFPYALVSAPGQLFAGLNDGRIYVSHDLGDTWQTLPLTGESLPSILALGYVE